MERKHLARKQGVRSTLTIRDVAKAAGVSVSTVSKALNGNGQLREETRTAVRSIAERLRFRPNEMARSLPGPRCFTVGLISIDRKGRFSIPVLDGVEDALGAAEISVFLCNTADNPERERQHVHSLLAKRVDGIIVTGGRAVAPPLDLEAVTSRHLRLCAGRRPDSLCLLPTIAPATACRRAPCQLGRQALRAHHRAGGSRSGAIVATVSRRAAEHGIALARERMLTGSWSEPAEAVGRLLATGAPLDAIFCGSDQIARGVVDALRDRGIRVPEDIAIVGFDNWEIIAAESRPPLTTIDMDLHELGRQAGMRLLALARDPAARTPTERALVGKQAAGVLRTVRWCRESCGAARADQRLRRRSRGCRNPVLPAKPFSLAVAMPLGKSSTARDPASFTTVSGRARRARRGRRRHHRVRARRSSACRSAPAASSARGWGCARPVRRLRICRSAIGRAPVRMMHRRSMQAILFSALSPRRRGSRSAIVRDAN